MEQWIERKMNLRVLYECLLTCCLYGWKIGLRHSQRELDGHHFFYFTLFLHVSLNSLRV